MKTVILHIGLHKTGTTSIQGALKAHRDHLCTLGIDYIPVGYGRTTTEHLGHHNLAWRLAGDERGRDDALDWERAVAHIAASPHPVSIISSEAFSLCGEDAIATIAQHLTDFRVIVALMLRNPVDLQQSRLREWANGWFPFCVDAYIDATLHEPRLAYADMVRRWDAGFGAGATHVLFFEQEMGDLPGALLRLAGQPGALAGFPVERLNASLGWAHLGLNMAASRLLYGSTHSRFFRTEIASPLMRGRTLTGGKRGDLFTQAQADRIIAGMRPQMLAIRAASPDMPDSYVTARRMDTIIPIDWSEDVVHQIVRPMLNQRLLYLTERTRHLRAAGKADAAKAVNQRRAEVEAVLKRDWTMVPPVREIDADYLFKGD